MKFNKVRLMHNINELVSQSNIKIGELEAQVGVSTGYLSRIGKADNETVPNVDLVAKIADVLDVSIDALLSFDFSISNNNVLYLYKFFHRLITDTEFHQIDWIRETKATLKKVETREANHPLFQEMPESNTYDRRLAYISPFITDTPVNISGDCYKGFVANLGTIYVMHLETNRSNEELTDFWEMRLVEDVYNPEDMFSNVIDISNICCTVGRGKDLIPAFNDLLKCIKKQQTDVQLNSEIRSKIANYLNTSSIEEELPFKI